MSVCSNDACAADQALDIFVLVSVKHELRLCSLDVLVERGKSHVHVIFAIMDQTRRIVGNEDVHRRKVGQISPDFGVFKKVIATRLVFPGTAETAKCDAAKLEDAYRCRSRIGTGKSALES